MNESVEQSETVAEACDSAPASGRAVGCDDLLACPFCGSRKVNAKWRGLPGDWTCAVECEDCQARGPAQYKIAKQTVIMVACAAWNRRAL